MASTLVAGPTVTPGGRDPARLHAFSDGVFAFAATLLVVTLRVPDSYAELLDALAGFPALGLAFAAIVSLWAIHRDFFARYPLGDSWSVAINAVLLFVVLLYVYPLKLLAELASERFLGVGSARIADVRPTDIQGVYVVFGAAVLATCVALAALHLRAWQLRAELGLDAAGRAELVAAGLTYVGIGGVAGLSIVVAALGLGLGWGLPVWLLLVLSPGLELVRIRTSRRRAGAARRRARLRPDRGGEAGR